MTSSSSDSEEDRKRKRKHKKEKSEKKDKKERRSKKDKREKRHKSDKQPSERSIVAVEEIISENDYFLKTQQFQEWLSSVRGTYLDEISSDEARRLFRKFCDKWNAGELSQDLYRTGHGAGSVKSSGPAASRTRHEWSFVSKLSDVDQMQLDRTVSGVGAQTNHDPRATGSTSTIGAKPLQGPSAGPSAEPARGPAQQPARGPLPPGLGAGAQRGPGPAAAPSRLAELQAKEQQRLDAFKRSMGL
jgi:hypothetical protein